MFIFGLSMGGLISFQVALKRSKHLNGCIFVNPAFQDNPVNKPLLKKMMMFSKVFFPKSRTLKSFKSSSTRTSLEHYLKHDPLIYQGRVWTSTTWALLSNMYTTSQRFPDFRTPYLCIQGGSDKLLNMFSVFDLEEQSKAEDK